MALRVLYLILVLGFVIALLDIAEGRVKSILMSAPRIPVKTAQRVPMVSILTLVIVSLDMKVINVKFQKGIGLDTRVLM